MDYKLCYLNENKTEAITVISLPVNQSAVAKSIQLGGVTIPLSTSSRVTMTL